MPTQELNEHIPTLTQIIQSGDASMENHFDASYFDNDNKDLGINKNHESQEEILVTDTDSAQETEQELLENSFDTQANKDNECDNKTNADEINEESEDFTYISKTDEEYKGATSTATANDLKIKEYELKDTVDLLISEAVKEALPSIEKQLTEKLGKQLYQKLISELSKDS